jgi:hypothetical protein
MESIGTKAYTRRELLRIFGKLPVEYLRIQTEVTSADVLSASAFPPLNWCFRAAIRLFGIKYPYHTSHYGTRVDASGNSQNSGQLQRPDQIIVTGHPLGFFHCISGRKKAS